MDVYKFLHFCKEYKIVPEVFGRQQTLDSCNFDIHTLLHLQDLERYVGQCPPLLYL